MGTLVLGAKSRKAKNRLRQWGIKWEILRDYQGNWLVVSERDNTDNTDNNDSIRWVNQICDPDFNIVEYVKED